MKKIILFAIVLFQLSSCEGQINQLIHDNNVISGDTLETQIDALVKSYMDIDIFSGVVLIAQKGKPIYHKAFGLADREKKIANTKNTKFDIGSMNKTFTKVVVMQLIEEGKLKLSAHLSTILPAFSDQKYSNITIGHLLEHSSGFGDYHMIPGYFDLPIEEKDLASSVKRIKQLPLLFEAGTEQEYSNAGYILLGAIIESKTQKSYFQNVRERIVAPLNLKETYLENKYDVPDRAIGYYKTMKGHFEDNTGFQELPAPDGGFQSTAEDVMKFYCEYHYGNTLLKEETKSKDKFFGMIQEHQNTGGAIPHAGGFEGANTVHYEILRDKISVVVMANMDEPVAEQLGAGILAIIRGKVPQQPSLPAVINVYKMYSNHGIDYIKEHFSELTTNFHPTDPKSLILNNIGYNFLQNNQINEAIEIFTLNTQMFPEDANVWDSLGEGFLNKGDLEKAKTNYQKALKMDPGMQSAKEALQKLKQ